MEMPFTASFRAMSWGVETITAPVDCLSKRYGGVGSEGVEGITVEIDLLGYSQLGVSSARRQV